MEVVENLLEALQGLTEDHLRQCTNLSKLELEVDRVKQMVLGARTNRRPYSQKSGSHLEPYEPLKASETHNNQRCEVRSGSHTPLSSSEPPPSLPALAPSTPPAPAPAPAPAPSSSAPPPQPPPPSPSSAPPTPPASPPLSPSAPNPLSTSLSAAPSPSSGLQVSEQTQELLRKLIQDWDNITAFLHTNLDIDTQQDFPEAEDPLLQDATLQRPRTSANILRQQFARPLGYLEYLYWREAPSRKKSTKTGPFIRQRGYQNFGSAVQMLSDGKKMLTIVGLYSIPTISPEKFDERLTFTWMKKQPWEWGILLVLASTSCLTLPFRDIYSFCSLLRENDEIRKAISSHRGKGRDLIHNYQRNVNVRRGAVKVIRESRSTIDVYQQGSILPGGADAEAINFQSRQHTVGFISNTDANVNASPDHVIADATHLRANLSSNSLRNFHVPKQLERADDRIEHFPVSFEDTILSVAENITPQKRLPTSGEFDATSKRQRPNSLQSDEIAANPASRAAHVSPVTSNRHDIGSENNGASGFMVQYDPPYFDHHTEPSQGKPHSRLARKHCRTDDGLERANASTKSAFRTAQNYQQQTAGNSETSNESFFSDTNVSSAEPASSEAPLSSKLPSLIDDAGTTVSMPDDSDELQNVRILGGNHRQQRVSARNEHITEEQVEGSNQVTSPMIDNILTDASSLYPPYQVSLTDATAPGIPFDITSADARSLNVPYQESVTDATVPVFSFDNIAVDASSLYTPYQLSGTDTTVSTFSFDNIAVDASSLYTPYQLSGTDTIAPDLYFDDVEIDASSLYPQYQLSDVPSAWSQRPLENDVAAEASVFWPCNQRSLG